MNHVVAEMNAILDGDEEALQHIGMPRRSGRYPWGSGEDPYQHGMDFLARYEKLRKEGKSEAEIAKELNMLDSNGNPSTGTLRLEKRYCTDMRKIHQMETARALAEDGLGPTEIARKMGLKNESTARSLLDPSREARTKLTAELADFLRDQVDQKKMIDITSGVEKEMSLEKQLNISKERLKEAVYILEKEGYVTYKGGIDQLTNKNQQTTQKVLCVPGTQHKDIYELDKVKTIYEYTSNDGGRTFNTTKYPISLDPKRLKVLLADDIGPDGERGIDKDGIIQIRRGVPDLSLGDARYSQVRILVGKDKYLKGMAVYSDNMPDGVDVIFNSNKTSYEKALKPIKQNDLDPNNPFGTSLKPGKLGQPTYFDKDGVERQSIINKKSDEGDWSDWTDTLPSQFLSKQSQSLAKKQLGLAKADKMAEFDEICSNTNPTVKKFLLNKFADECDAAAVDLKAAALPGQKYHVMIPVNTLKDNEVYAPGYDNGTKLALIRYPHAGTFEIPILTVNNKHPQARKLIGTDTRDAVGLNKKNAEQLSGADFDGDTVMCIPTHDGRTKIIATKPLQGLVGFDPQLEYPKREGMKYMKDPITGKDNTQKEMGVISNLISDMTLRGAPPSDMEKAVRHSMVVIDAAKHQLDYKRSEADNQIASLKKRWQRSVLPDGSIKEGGASTIISRSKGEYSVEARQGTPKVNLKGTDWYDPTKPEGSLVYKTADDLYYPIRKKDQDGNTVLRTVDGKKVVYNSKDPAQYEKYNPIQVKDEKTGAVKFTNKAGDLEYKYDYRKFKSTRMAEVDDARELMSSKEHPHPMELIYADYANSMKALANEARLESIATKETAYSSDAKKKYNTEYNSLMEKLTFAEVNSVKQRAALRKANVEIQKLESDNPNMSKADKGKYRQRAVSNARDEVGAISRRDRNIPITDREWEAIQAGAISKTQLTKILNNTDIALVRELSTPKTTKQMSTAKVTKAKVMRDSGATLAEISSAVGVSVATVQKYLKGGN